MQTIIVSDIHLTHHFDERKYRFLHALFSRADRVILNGDIWDSFHSDWARFSQSSWRHLFPLLRSKQAVYIFGNHDEFVYTPEPWLLATDWGDDLDLPWNGTSLHIEHGHAIGHSFDINHPWLANLFREVVPYRLWSFRDVEWNRRTDRAMRIAAAQIYGPHQTLIVGHSHLPAVDLHQNYANSGFIYGGKASWIEMTPTSLQLQTAKY